MFRAPRLAALALWLAGIGSASGCQTPQRNGASASSAPERPAIDLVAETPWPPAYAADPQWRRAASGDDLDEARLAQRESVARLLAALEHGGSLGQTALRALAYAPDRRQARKRLCELAIGATPATQALLLGAIFQAVVEAPLDEEAVDALADATCRAVLVKLSETEQVAPSDRDRAQAALARLGGAP